MRVVLLEDVENIGRAGEVVEVSDGHGRNFLFPRGLAAAATQSRVQEAESKHAHAARASEEELAAMQQLAELADQKTVQVERLMGPQGKLHGAVTAKEISAAIESALQVSLPPDVIRLSEPINEPGTYNVALEFPHGLEAEVTIVVVGSKPERDSAERTETP